MLNICSPLSRRSFVKRVWFDDAVYVNCYDITKKPDNDTICIFDLLKEEYRCPRKDDIVCVAT
jgi:hypothetical protein